MSQYTGPIVALALVACVAGFIIGTLMAVDTYHVQAVARGYAHYDLNSTWHWNTDAPR